MSYVCLRCGVTFTIGRSNEFCGRECEDRFYGIGQPVVGRPYAALRQWFQKPRVGTLIELRRERSVLYGRLRYVRENGTDGDYVVPAHQLIWMHAIDSNGNELVGYWTERATAAVKRATGERLVRLEAYIQARAEREERRRQRRGDWSR